MARILTVKNTGLTAVRREHEYNYCISLSINYPISWVLTIQILKFGDLKHFLVTTALGPPHLWRLDNTIGQISAPLTSG